MRLFIFAQNLRTN